MKSNLIWPFNHLPKWLMMTLLVILFPFILVIAAIVSMFSYDARVQDIYRGYQNVFRDL